MKRTPAALVRAVPILLVTLLALSSTARGQSFAVEKYKLPNGMTVILYPDHTLPIAAINIWYRVGSKDEPAHRSGFAHLFEHLMFMGTDRVPNGEFDRIMEAAGGSNNASTVADGTHYYSSGPASLLPTLLWLDADRLEDLPRAMDQKKVDLQRDVVLNELRQSYENQPYGRADLAIQQLLYPPSHPYHFPTIGTAEDLRAAVAADVKDFFATYYVPNNASLVVAGDFDPAAIKPLVERLFGTLPRGGEPPRKPVPSAALDGVKRGAMYDKVQLPLVSFAYNTPPGLTQGDANSRPPRLRPRGRQEQPPLQAPRHRRPARARPSRPRTRARSSGRISGSTSRHGPTRISTASRRPSTRRSPGSSRAESARTSSPSARRRRSSRSSRRSQRLEARADLMNYYEDAWGEPNGFKRDLDRYRTATPASVLATAKQVLTPNARVVFRVLPEQPKRAPSARDARPPDGAGLRVPSDAARALPSRERDSRRALEDARPASHARLGRVPPGGRTRPERREGRPRVPRREHARRGRRDARRARVRRGRREPRRELLVGSVTAVRPGEPDDPLAQRRRGRAAPRGRGPAASPRGAGLRARQEAHARRDRPVRRRRPSGGRPGRRARSLRRRPSVRLAGGRHGGLGRRAHARGREGRARRGREARDGDARRREQPAPSEVRAALEKAFGDWKAASPAPKALPIPAAYAPGGSGSARVPRGPAGRAADDRSFPRARRRGSRTPLAFRCGSSGRSSEAASRAG